MVTYVNTHMMPGAVLCPALGSYLGGEMRQEGYALSQILNLNGDGGLMLKVVLS